jgi:hypothetical protein
LHQPSGKKRREIAELEAVLIEKSVNFLAEALVPRRVERRLQAAVPKRS